LHDREPLRAQPLRGGGASWPGPGSAARRWPATWPRPWRSVPRALA